MLTKEQILENKNRAINLIRSISIEGVDNNPLLDLLEEGGYFYAPASTQYFGSYEGGLCEHSLKVYDILTELASTYARIPLGDSTTPVYNNDSLILVALLHDLYKMDYYEIYIKNEKVYSPLGKKVDEIGKFDWVSSKCYKVKDSRYRLTMGDNQVNTLMLINSAFPYLTQEETCAILNSDGGLSNGYANKDLSAIYSKSPLATLLHCADMIATYINDEK